MGVLRSGLALIVGLGLSYVFYETTLLSAIVSRINISGVPREYVILGIIVFISGLIAAKGGSGSSVGFLVAILSPAIEMIAVLIRRFISELDVQLFLEFFDVYMTWFALHTMELIIPIAIGIVVGFIGGVIGKRLFKVSDEY